MLASIKTYIDRYPLLLLVLLCIITRIPQLASPHLFLDPDECVTATMAKYMIEGKDFSLFFWGQRYGLTIIETLFIVPFYLVLGVSTLSVKLGILTLWTIGVVFLYKTLFVLSNKRTGRAVLFTAFFILLPSWAVWSMKARGGYVTAFTLSMLLLWLLFQQEKLHQLKIWIIIGLLLQLIYQSQALLLIGILPLLFFVLLKQKNIRQCLAMILPLIATGIFFSWYKETILWPYVPTNLKLPKWQELGFFAARFPDYLYNSFHGNYYFSEFYSPGLFSAVCSICCVVLTFALFIAGVYFLLRRRKGNVLFIYATLFIIGFYLLSHLSFYREGRYLLPMTCFMVISLCIFCNRFDSLKQLKYPADLLLLFGAISSWSFYHFEFEKNKRQDITRLVAYMKANKLNYTFCSDCMLPWHITFYSGEQLISRMPYYPGRYKSYPDSVNRRFMNGETIALVGYVKNLTDTDTGTYSIVGPFYIFKNPSRQKILDNFHFTPN